MQVTPKQIRELRAAIASDDPVRVGALLDELRREARDLRHQSFPTREARDYVEGVLDDTLLLLSEPELAWQEQWALAEQLATCSAAVQALEPAGGLLTGLLRLAVQGARDRVLADPTAWTEVSVPLDDVELLPFSSLVAAAEALMDPHDGDLEH
jgi:hypothetical protein